MTERQMQLEDWLDDLCVRFIINLPQDNLASVERICFQIEEAQWFYEDFIRPLDPNLPSFSLRNFSLRVFSHCPLLSAFAVSGRHMQAFDEFLAYKNRIPVRGAIMLNEAMDATVLVKGWKKGANWSFPRGKINKDEDDLICAIREVYEETGLDLEAAGLIPHDRKVKQIEINIREQQMRLYVFKNVPMDTHFEPRTRKEISKIQWWRLSDLPAFKKKTGNQEAAVNANKFYMVAPFLVPLRKWINEQHRLNAQNTINLPVSMVPDGFLTEDDRAEDSGTQAIYEVSGPESTGFEESGDLLSRLLKKQPPTQFSQPRSGGDIPLSQGHSSGQALLALLQSKPVPAEPIQSQPPPQTPLEQLMGIAPIPNPPHHHHPHPPRFSEMPPAPHYAGQTSENTFGYSNPGAQRVQFSHLEASHGFPSNLPQSRPLANPHHNQPQHLIHPQPLPPNVQKAVFTGDIIHPPQMSNASRQPVSNQHMNYPQPAQWNPQVINQSTMGASQSTQAHPPLEQAVRREAPSQLNNHSLNLLNAFKTTNSLANAVIAPEPLDSRKAPVLHNAPQELPAELSHITSPPQYGAASLQNPQTGLGAAPPRQPISAEQKSTLLDMFKSPAAQTAVPTKTFAANALPISNTPSAVELSAVEPHSSVSQSAEKGAKASRGTDGSVPELTTQTNLSFRPKKILSRPVEKASREDEPRRPHDNNSHSNKHPQQHTNVSPGPAQPAPSKVFAPQILKRPQPDVSHNTAATTHSDAHGVSAPLPKQPPNLEASGPVVSPEHKQALLSLFGKPSPVPTVLPSPIVSRTSTLDVLSAVSPADIASKSRVGSIVSLDTSSRRGSQAPLSKANESFLLGYLDAFTGGSQR